MTHKDRSRFFWRVGAFAGLFVLASGVLGPRIISSNLLNQYYFSVYGSLGKALLFALVAFGLLVYRQFHEVRLQPYQKSGTWWLVAYGVCFALAYYGISQLQTDGTHVDWAIVTHLCLVAIGLCAALGCLGLQNMQAIARRFKRELVVSIGLALGFVLFLYMVYALWKPLAVVVLHSVRGLLAISGIPVATVPPFSLVTDKFGVQVAQYCSGIESIALFTGLYVLIGVLDWKRLNHTRYFGAFVPALAGLFAFNILRVYVLILAGYHLNPQIAFSLFHTYAGMVFFILYAAAFWWLAYAWMLRTGQPKESGRES